MKYCPTCNKGVSENKENECPVCHSQITTIPAEVAPIPE